MTVLLIILGIFAIGFVIFRMGGKELDRRLTAVGGIRTMYSPLIDAMLSMPNAHIIKNLPASVTIEGCFGSGSYDWNVKTLDGKKITISFTVKEGNILKERKVFDFPISSQWSSVEILATLHNQIEHKNILDNKSLNTELSDTKEQNKWVVDKYRELIARLQMKDSEHSDLFNISVSINCADCYEFYINMKYGHYKYTITKWLGKLRVSLDSQNYIKGKWEFPLDMNQTAMADKIEADIDAMVMKKYN